MNESNAEVTFNVDFLFPVVVYDNPYAGHTLKDALAQVKRVAVSPEHVFVDMASLTIHSYKPTEPPPAGCKGSPRSAVGCYG